jgi:hypothetical protein
VVLKLTTTKDAGVGVVRVVVHWQKLTPAVVVTDTFTFSIIAGNTASFNVPLSSDRGTNDLQCDYVNPAGSGVTSTIDAEFSFYCNGDVPGGTTGACCPPDPVAQQMLDEIIRDVTLLQRQLAPFAYITGAAHAGLVGQGSFAVPADLGMRIDLTTVPPSLGQEVGTPNFVFDAGWVSILSPDGFIEERRVSAVNGVWFPKAMSAATIIGYSFAPGVVATVTELLREP